MIELTVRRDQVRRLWKDAWEEHGLSAVVERVDTARVVIDRLEVFPSRSTHGVALPGARRRSF